MTTTRSPRHRSKEYQGVHTSEAILRVAEQVCADEGYSRLKIATIAKTLKIESPAVYQHYRGLPGITGALARRTFELHISLFDDLEDMAFKEAFMTLSARTIDLFIARPGIARFILADLSTPGGLEGFDNEETLDLERQLAALHRQLFARQKYKSSSKQSVVTLEAARLGPALVGMALNSIVAGENRRSDSILREEYLCSMQQIVGSA